MRGDEITAQIPRAELLGLLNTMSPFEQQRVTAEFAAPADPTIEPFAAPVKPVLASWLIVAVSCLVTLGLAGLCLAVA